MCQYVTAIEGERFFFVALVQIIGDDDNFQQACPLALSSRTPTSSYSYLLHLMLWGKGTFPLNLHLPITADSYLNGNHKI